MILLDTNFLIRSLVGGCEEATRVSEWLAERETFCTSAIAWYEFLSGPVDEEGVEIISALISERVIPFDAEMAVEAARLFNSVGRVRRLRVDSMIAATGILIDAAIATENTHDFRAFAEHGVRLA